MNERTRLAKYLLVAAPFLALAACDGGEGGSAAPAAFTACTSCHSVEPDSTNGAGPNLRDIIGRTAGKADGFAYSNAMRESGLVWSPETLDRFLAEPTEVVPGTRMVTKVKDPAQRQVVIDYLMTLSSERSGSGGLAPSPDASD